MCVCVLCVWHEFLIKVPTSNVSLPFFSTLYKWFPIKKITTTRTKTMAITRTTVTVNYTDNKNKNNNNNNNNNNDNNNNIWKLTLWFSILILNICINNSWWHSVKHHVGVCSKKPFTYYESFPSTKQKLFIQNIMKNSLIVFQLACFIVLCQGRLRRSISNNSTAEGIRTASKESNSFHQDDETT